MVDKRRLQKGSGRNIRPVDEVLAECSIPIDLLNIREIIPMREIKFRVWDGDQRCFECPVGVTATGKAFKWYKLGECIEFTEKPQQYTGLKDKNGVEIYEGDIVLMPYFLPDSPRQKYIVRLEEWGYNYGYKIEIQNGEVLGNVYENPELLENRE